MTPWFDLVAALPDLDAVPEYKELGTAIRKLRSLYAVMPDLETARSAIDLLMSMPPGKHEPHSLAKKNTLIADSLFTNAVISYCRAVHTPAASDRWRVIKDTHLSSEERKQHRLITELRDKVVAHHGYGESHPEVPWLKDTLTFRVSPGRLSIRGAWIRLNTSIPATEALNLLTARALARAQELEPAMRNAVGEAFAKADQGGGAFREIVTRTKFDGPTFFGDHPGWNVHTSDFDLSPGDQTFSRSK
jgi:hypothetical protein